MGKFVFRTDNFVERGKAPRIEWLMDLERMVKRGLETAARAVDGEEFDEKLLLDNASRFEVQVGVCVGHGRKLQGFGHGVLPVVTDGARQQEQFRARAVVFDPHRPPLVVHNGAAHGRGRGVDGCGITARGRFQQGKGVGVTVVFEEGKIALLSSIDGDDVGIDPRTVRIAVVEDTRQEGLQGVALQTQANRKGGPSQRVGPVPLVTAHALGQPVRQDAVGIAQHHFALGQAQGGAEQGPLARLPLCGGRGVYPSCRPVVLPVGGDGPQPFGGCSEQRATR